MSSRHIVRRLAEELRSVEQASRANHEEPPFSTGIPSLDGLLPGGGLRRGMLIEWLPDDESGPSLMALLTAAGMRNAECGVRNEGKEERGKGGKGEQQRPQDLLTYSPTHLLTHSSALLIIDRHGTFYPPAAAAWGIPLASMILLRPTNARDEAWALDQALRSPAVAAVLAWPHRLDGRAFRRLQLAAESSGTIGVLVRPASARHEPTWADARLTCRVGTAHPTAKGTYSNGWRLRIERLHARGDVHPHDPIQIEITHTGQIHEIAPAKHMTGVKSAI